MNKKRCIALILGSAMITSSFAGISTFSAAELSANSKSNIINTTGTSDSNIYHIIGDLGAIYINSTKTLTFAKWSSKLHTCVEGIPNTKTLIPCTESSQPEWCEDNSNGYINIENIEIPSFIKNLPDYNFYGLSDLKSLNAPSVTSIGSYAFADCKSLETLNVPNLKSIKSYAFYNCESIKSLKVNKDATSIGSYAFADCSNLQDVTCSSKTNKATVSIGSYAFSSCDALYKFNLPNAKTLGSCCFDKSSNLKYVYAPKARVDKHCFGEREQSVVKAEVGSLNNYALENNTAMKTLVLNNATSIGNYALSGATGVRDIKAPKVTSVGNYAFKDTKLTSVYLTNVRNIGSYAFANCKTIEKAYLGTNISKVGSGAFLDCQKINNGINLDKVTEIGSNAFANCKLIRCTSLGNKLRSIGSQAFAGCNKISRLYIPSTTKKIGSNISSSVNSLSSSSVRVNDNTERIKIYTPKGSTIYNKYYKNSHNKKLLRNAVKKITVNKTNITLKKGKSYKLVFTISDSNAATKDINMTSSNTKVVKYLKSSHNKDNTVKYCYIKAMGKGTAYVTVKAKDGSNRTAKCKVTVK